jgi:hypothetical protein
MANDSDSVKEQRALVVRDEQALERRGDHDAERPMIATDLDRAAKGQLVYVGRDGDVKNPSSVRTVQLVQYLAFGGVTAAGVTLAAVAMPALLPLWAFVGGNFIVTQRAVRRVNEASVALSRGDSVSGRALAEPVTKSWWVPARVRAFAELRVAVADALDGNREKALERVRHARGRLSPRLIQHQFAYYTEVNLLTALGRTKEARAALEARGSVPAGEVLRLSHWMAQMHLWVAERAPRPATEGSYRTEAVRGDLEIDEVELHDRMRKGLSMTTGADLLLLCAWCYAQRGEHDDARFAYRQAQEREGSHSLEKSMPKLAEWLADYRQEHPEIEQPDAEEP